MDAGIVVPLINEMRMAPFAAPGPVTLGTKATPAQIIALKNHVVACADHINQVKAKMAMSQRALAALPAADVEAAVVTGYPPPA
jgi:hypothetical protein